MINKLSGVKLFHGLETAGIMKILNRIHYQVRHFRAGEMVFQSGDDCHDLYILLEGTVRGDIISYEGKSVAVSEIRAPGTFAEGYLFARRNILRINISSLTDSEIMFIRRDYFQLALEMEPRLQKNFNELISERFVTVTEKLNFLMIKNARGKLAYYLLGRQRELPGAKSFPMGKTHEELAVILGITRPALTRNLIEMRKSGIISIDRKMVRIHDPGRLSALIK